MKIIFLFFIQLFSISAIASEDVTMTWRDWQNRIQLAPVMGIVARRCDEAIACQQNKDSERAQCSSATGALKNAVVAIGSNGPYMKKWGQSDVALNYLKSLRKLLKSRSTSKPAKFNLWTFTLSSPGVDGDPKKAIELLSTLFRETSVKSEFMSDEIAKLRENLVAKIFAGVEAQNIDGYPPGVDSVRGEGGIYHFYTIALIAQDMKVQGVPDRFAAGLPYALNAVYVETNAKLDRGVDWVTRRLPELLGCREPKPAAERPVGEVYVGYAGVQFALSNDSRTFAGKSLLDFKTGYGDGTDAYVGQALREKLGGEQKFCEPSANR